MYRTKPEGKNRELYQRVLEPFDTACFGFLFRNDSCPWVRMFNFKLLFFALPNVRIFIYTLPHPYHSSVFSKVLLGQVPSVSSRCLLSDIAIEDAAWHLI